MKNLTFFFISFSSILLFLLPNISHGQDPSIAQELAAVLGLLPTSQLLVAGGGLLYIKMAIIARFLALIGVLPNHRRSGIPIEGMVYPSNGSVVSTTPKPGFPSKNYWGLPDLLHHFGYGKGEDSAGEASNCGACEETTDGISPSTTDVSVISELQTTANSSVFREETIPSMTTTKTEPPTSTEATITTTTSKVQQVGGGSTTSTVSASGRSFGSTDDFNSTTGPHVAHGVGSAYFPIPGLKIGFDNKTNKSVLLMDSEFQPSVIIPSFVADQLNLSDPIPMTDSFQKSLHKTLVNETQENLLLYPLHPSVISLPNMVEVGMSPSDNDSAVFIRLANGTIIPAGKEAIDIDVNGVQFDIAPTIPLANGLLQETLTISSSSSADKKETDLNSRRRRSVTSRRKRDLMSNIPMYFAVVSSMDTDDCFARLACEIGGNSSSYGRYGETVGRFFSRLRSGDFDPKSHAYYYVSHYENGKADGTESCSKDSRCSHDLQSLVAPLNQL